MSVQSFQRKSLNKHISQHFFFFLVCFRIASTLYAMQDDLSTVFQCCYNGPVNTLTMVFYRAMVIFLMQNCNWLLWKIGNKAVLLCHIERSSYSHYNVQQIQGRGKFSIIGQIIHGVHFQSGHNYSANLLFSTHCTGSKIFPNSPWEHLP